MGQGGDWLYGDTMPWEYKLQAARQHLLQLQIQDHQQDFDRVCAIRSRGFHQVFLIFTTLFNWHLQLYQSANENIVWAFPIVKDLLYNDFI